MLQEGIYWDSGQRPGRCLSLMFLRVRPETSAAQVGVTLQGLWATYDRLRRGEIRDLPGVDVGGGGLTVLLGFGPNVFKLTGIQRALPLELGPRHHFRRPTPEGNTILPGAGIRYAPGIARNPATEDIVVQAIADSPLAANRAIVEAWKHLADNPDPATGQPVADITTAYTGFNREDARSWLDFHDGISNLASGAERRAVLAIKDDGGADGWTADGTYLAFLRLSVDLAAWRRLSVAQQEFMVGRTKISGCPLSRVNAEGTPIAVDGCPVTGASSIVDADNAKFREPPVPTDQTVAASHVQRANHHNGIPVSRPDSARIFRQGYEFVDTPADGKPLALGLNFISFQDTPERLISMLTRPGWLGDVNFGGDAANQLPGMTALLTTHAAGVFLVPPVIEDEPFPGSSIFPLGIA